MRSFLVAAIAVFTVANAATPDGNKPPQFVPTGIFYLNGQFTELKQLAKPIASLSECMEKLQHAVATTESGVAMPAGAAVIGACVPVPSL